jgi:hypothetical protein
MTDRLEALRQAGLARHGATLRRAEEALQVLRDRGEPVTFAHVARAAKVSRSWLYRQSELRVEIERNRHSHPTKSVPAPPSHPATTESLRQQLAAYREEIARLRAENRALNDQLARHLGAQRADNVTRP